MIPYAHWLSSGDNAWQLTAATFVGLMSIPALAVLYGGLVQKKWAVNTVLMVFATFCLVLITWVLWAFKMGFGTPWIGGSLHLLGRPGAVLGTGALEGQANIPLLSGGMPSFRFPESSLVYFLGLLASQRDLFRIGQDAAATTGNESALLLAGLFYLALTVPLTHVVNVIDRRLREGRRADGAEAGGPDEDAEPPLPLTQEAH